jgi:hypothetical protein
MTAVSNPAQILPGKHWNNGRSKIVTASGLVGLGAAPPGVVQQGPIFGPTIHF